MQGANARELCQVPSPEGRLNLGWNMGWQRTHLEAALLGSEALFCAKHLAQVVTAFAAKRKGRERFLREVPVSARGQLLLLLDPNRIRSPSPLHAAFRRLRALTIGEGSWNEDTKRTLDEMTIPIKDAMAPGEITSTNINHEICMSYLHDPWL